MYKTILAGALGALSSCMVTTSVLAIGCDTKQSHQFDFWIGKWNVYPNVIGARQIATSLIESLYDGCALRENWMPFNGGDGGSLSVYSQATSQWEQFWTDVTGAAVHQTGGWNGKSMVIVGVWAQPGYPNALSRITWTPLKKRRVEQFGESSFDDGKTWKPAFDFIYRPAK